MARHSKKSRSKKTGLPPGSLVYIGSQAAEASKVTLCEYDGDHVIKKKILNLEDLRNLKGKPTVSWVNVKGIHDPSLLEQLGDIFGIHALILEDILNTDHRPKMEEMEELFSYR